MSPIRRACLLSLVLLLQGLGNAWASMPAPLSKPVATVQQAMADDGSAAQAMPCHGGEAAQATPAAGDTGPGMPCCDDGNCHCSIGCNATPALAPPSAELDEYLRLHLEAVSGQPALLPAHLHLLLRPPASSEG